MSIAGTPTTIIGTPTCIKDTCCDLCGDDLVLCEDGITNPVKVSGITLSVEGLPAKVGSKFVDVGDGGTFENGFCEEYTYTREAETSVTGLDNFNGTYAASLVRRSDGAIITDSAIIADIAAAPAGSAAVECFNDEYMYRVYVPTVNGTLTLKDVWDPPFPTSPVQDLDITETGYWRLGWDEVLAEIVFLWKSFSTNRAYKVGVATANNTQLTTDGGASTNGTDTELQWMPLSYCNSCGSILDPTSNQPCSYVEDIETTIMAVIPDGARTVGTCGGSTGTVARTNTLYNVDGSVELSFTATEAE